MTIGVLALQGDFARHRAALDRIDVPSLEIRRPGQLDQVTGLIVPGGESTTLLKLLDAWDFVPALEKFHAAGKPIFGTCAGLILLAREVHNPSQLSLGFIDLAVERNAYGRQKESFSTMGTADLGAGRAPLEMVFIRAPRILRMGSAVTPIGWHNDECVMARQGSVLVAAFHPELTDRPAVHQYFVRLVRAPAEAGGEGASPPASVGRSQ